MNWIILVSVVYDTGTLYNFLGRENFLRFRKKCLTLEDFTAWSYLVYLLLY